MWKGLFRAFICVYGQAQAQAQAHAPYPSTSITYSYFVCRPDFHSMHGIQMPTMNLCMERPGITHSIFHHFSWLDFIKEMKFMYFGRVALRISRPRWAQHSTRKWENSLASFVHLFAKRKNKSSQRTQTVIASYNRDEHKMENSEAKANRHRSSFYRKMQKWYRKWQFCNSVFCQSGSGECWAFGGV